MNTGRKIALLTAAGIAERFGGLMAKEMYPLGFEKNQDGKTVPVPISKYTFDALRQIKPDFFTFVVRSDKPQILRYYGDGKSFPENIMYLVQDDPISQYVSMSRIRDFMQDGDTIYYAMPDTAIHPNSLFVDLDTVHNEKKADITIGLFEVDEPEHFTTVELDKDGEFVVAEVKPEKPTTKWIWGVLVFNERFFEMGDDLGVEKVGAVGSDDVGAVLNHAAKSGLKVACHKIKGGRYRDFANFERVVGFIQDATI